MRASPRWLARTGLVVVLAAGGVLAAASPAFATDCASLQTVLTNAANGSTVTLDEGSVCTGPFTLPNTSITLEGDGSGATIEGTAGARAISGVDIGTTRITNLTIRNGAGPGDGGAMVITGDSAPTFDHMTFLANVAGSGSGGALRIASTATSGSISFDTVTFGDGTSLGANTASGAGGALSITAGINVAINDSDFLANMSNDSGGGAVALGATAGADVTAADSTFDGNRANGTSADLGGGALRIDASTGSAIAVSSNTFTGNEVVAGATGTKAYGGALYLAYPDLAGLPTAALSSNTWQGNSVSGGSSSSFDPRGAALSSAGVIVTSKRDIFTDNHLGLGKPNFARGGVVSLAACQSSGAAQNVFDQDVIAGNQSAGSTLGGAIYTSCNLLPTSLKIRQSTIAGNQVAAGTAAVWGGPNDVLTSDNSIIASNVGPVEITGFTTRAATYTVACVSGQPIFGVGNFCADPRLADPIAGDISETASSPSVDAGSNAIATGITTDFEGQPRLQDGNGDSTSVVDIGADERPFAVGCDKLPADLLRALAGAVIRLTAGSVCAGSYVLPAVPITIAGEGTGATFEAVAGRSIYGHDAGNTTLRNLTFTSGEGSPGGAVLFDGNSTPTLDTVTFLDNHSNDVGGALAIQNAAGVGQITLQRVHFGDGTAGGGNSATKGGGAAIYPGPASVFITLTSFDQNLASAGAGGGLYLARGTASHVLKTVQFTDNRVLPESGFDGAGGGAWVGAAPPGIPLQLSGIEFTENTIGAGVGTLAGAGLAVVGSTPDDHVFQANNRFTRNSFEDPSAAALVRGGGESVSSAALATEEDRFIGNQIGDHGSAEARGVGLALEGCTTTFPGTRHTVTNDVFVGNEATGDASGAAIYVACAGGTGTVTVLNSTITGNSAGGTSGLWGSADTGLTVTNTILTANTGGDELTGFGQPAITYSDFCAAGAPAAGVGNICADPLLQDIPGGDVHETAASPTIDRGSNAAIPSTMANDYEGHNRIIDGDRNGSEIVDIGADEKAPPTPTIGPIIVPPFDPGPIFGGSPGAAPHPPAAPAPQQQVAGVKTSGGTKAPPKKARKCGDRTGPTSRFLNRLSKAAVFKGGPAKLLVRGMARYKKCAGGRKGTIKRVNFTIKLVEGNRCRFLTKAGTLGAPTSCKKNGRLFRAKGTTRWSYTLRGPLPAGKYLAQVQAVDNLGNKERASSHRNFRHFRINGIKLRQGWNGNHPDDYTKRG